jgi:hypothetical protein
VFRSRQEIGEQRAYEKACQALREGAPDIRRKLAAQEMAAAALCSIGLSSTSSNSADTSSPYSQYPDHRRCRSDEPRVEGQRCDKKRRVETATTDVSASASEDRDDHAEDSRASSRLIGDTERNDRE